MDDSQPGPQSQSDPRAGLSAGPAVPASQSSAASPSDFSNTPGWLRAFISLTVPDFRLLWIGTLFSMAAMQVNVIARVWLAYHITGSALALGIVAAARGVPQLALFPVSGYVADRMEKRVLIFTSQTLLALLALANAILVHLGIIQVWHLVVIGVLQGMIFPFNQLSRQAYIPALVRDKRLSNALALNASGRNIMQVLAPSVGGVLIAFNPTIAFYFIALLYGGAVFMVLQLPRSQPESKSNRGIVKEMAVGFQETWRRPVLRMLILTLLVVVVLGRPYQQILTVFQVSVLHVGATQLGFMYAVVGAGSILGSMGIAYFSESPRMAPVMVVSGLLFGGSLALFASTTSFTVALVYLFLTGLLSQGFMTVNSVLTVLHCERAVYGRVVSVRQMVMSLMSVSTVPIAALVDLMGPRKAVGGAGVVLVGVLVIMALFQRRAIRSGPATLPATPPPTGER